LVQGINKTGTYALGGHKNALAQRFGSGVRTGPLTRKTSDTPGPGTYNDIN